MLKPMEECSHREIPLLKIRVRKELTSWYEMYSWYIWNQKIMRCRSLERLLYKMNEYCKEYLHWINGVGLPSKS